MRVAHGLSAGLNHALRVPPLSAPVESGDIISSSAMASFEFVLRPDLAAIARPRDSLLFTHSSDPPPLSVLLAKIWLIEIVASL
jgi:hypothetical protein